MPQKQYYDPSTGEPVQKQYYDPATGEPIGGQVTEPTSIRDATSQELADIGIPSKSKKSLLGHLYDSPFAEELAKEEFEATTPRLSEQGTWLPQIKGFAAGAGRAATEMATSPAQAIQALFPASRLLNVPMGLGQMAYGVEKLRKGDTWGGAADIGFGALGTLFPFAAGKGRVGAVADDVAGGATKTPPPPRPSPTPAPDFQPGFRGRTTGGARPGDIPVTAAEYPPVRPPSTGSAWDDFNHQVFRDQEISAGRPDPGPRRPQETGMVPYRGEPTPPPEPVPQAVGEAAFRIVKNYHDGVIPPQITNDQQLVAYAESIDPEGMRAVTQPPVEQSPTVMDRGDVIDQGTGEVVGQETIPPIRPSVNPAMTAQPIPPTTGARPVATDVRQDTSQKIRELFRTELPTVPAPVDPVLQRFAEEGFATQPPAGPTQDVWASLPIRPETPAGPTPDLPLRPSVPGEDEPSRIEQPPAPQPREGEDEADARLREYLEKEDVVLPESQDIQMPPEDKPQEMRVPGTRVGGGLENIAIGPSMEDTRILDVLGTSLYTQDTASTAVKELFQNSGDEMKITGSSQPIRVLFRNSTEHPVTQAGAKSIVIKDFGRGLTPEQLYTIFTDVGKTGKGNEPLASGGFGFAKAAPLLGGDYVRVRSVVQDPESGSKVAYSFEGDPEQLKNQQVGVPLKDELVDDSTPTGMEVEVFLPEGKSLYSAENMLKLIVENSPHVKNVQFFEGYSRRFEDEFLETGTATGGYSQPEILEGKPIPPKQGVLSLPEADITFYYELDNLERQQGTIVYLNKGLFTSAKGMSYGYQPRPHVPAKIIIDIDPKVEEGAEGYAFGLNREAINQEILNATNKWIRENITDPAETAMIGELAKVFNSLKPAGRNTHVIYDSGKRYEPQELRKVVNNPNLRVIAGLMEDMLEQLDTLFPTEQLGRTIKHGFIMADNTMGGINLGNPGVPQGQPREFAILVNVLGLLSKARNPQEAAEMIAHTILHEFNHNMVRAEGGSFTWQLLQTDSRFGTRSRANVVDAILRALTGPTGQLDGGIQELLSEYTTARGRPDTEVDALTRQRQAEWLGGERPSRVSSSDRDARAGASGGGKKPPRSPDAPSYAREEPPPGDGGKRRRTSRYKGQYTNPASRNWANRVDKLDAEGAPDAMYREILPKGMQNQPLPGQTWRDTVIDAINRLEAFAAEGGAGGRGGTPPPGGHGPFATGDPRTPGGRGRTPGPPEIPVSRFREYWEFFRHALSGDLPFLTSAAWRQAAPLFGTSAWRRAFTAGARAYSSVDAERAILADLRGNIVHQKRWVNGRRISIFDELKVARSDATTMTGAEGRVQKSLIDRIPLINWHYAGNNRSFNIFLEAVRTYQLEEWLKAANAIDGTRITNRIDAQKLANTLNELTGHGSLRFRTPIVGRMGSKTELNLEQAGKYLSEVFWTPRQLVRDARMMNPLNYAMTPDLVRKEYMLGAIRRAGVWAGLTTLAATALGAKVSWNPTNSDFGKARIGNTRLDAGSGMLQWIVLWARQLLGETTSSSTGITREFGSSPVAPSRYEAIHEFLKNRLHPTPSLFIDALSATQEAPFYPGSSVLERSIAMPVSDMIDLMMENPDVEQILLGLIGTLTSAGSLTYGPREYGKPEYNIPGDIPLEGGSPMGLLSPRTQHKLRRMF